MKLSATILFMFLGGANQIANAESRKDDVVNFAMAHTKIISREVYEKYKDEKKVYFSEWKTNNNLTFFFVGIKKQGSDDAFSAIFQNCSESGSGLRVVASGESLTKDMLSTYHMVSKEKPIYENVCQCERAFD